MRAEVHDEQAEGACALCSMPSVVDAEVASLHSMWQLLLRAMCAATVVPEGGAPL